jgi:hypothetical protein
MAPRKLTATIHVTKSYSLSIENINYLREEAERKKKRGEKKATQSGILNALVDEARNASINSRGRSA